MCAWGYGIFQSEGHLDQALNISMEAGIELYRVKEDYREEICTHLDSGLLDTLFDRYLNETYRQDYAIVILGALAMRLGARLNDAQLKVLWRLTFRVEMYKKGKDQMYEAIRNYKNDGTPWQFDSPSWVEVLERTEEMNSNLSFQQAIDMHSIKEDVPHGRRIGRPSPFWMYNEKEVGKPHPVHGWPTFGPPLPMTREQIWAATMAGKISEHGRLDSLIR